MPIVRNMHVIFSGVVDVQWGHGDVIFGAHCVDIDR